VGTLADKSIVRDGWGRPIIPGSQVKGKARHATEALARSLGLHVYQLFDDDATKGKDVVRALFGTPMQRSPLHFADLVGLVGDGEPARVPSPSSDPLLRRPNGMGTIRPSVSLNRRRGTSEEARLLFQETAFEGMRFVSQRAIIGTLDEQEGWGVYSPAIPADEHLGHVALLWAALRMITRWGGAKSRGLGWSTVTVDVDCDGEKVSVARLEQELRNLVAKKVSEASSQEGVTQ
jgi:CRISPR/Cas system CSM-associated protein Csm3 (group 7 of RAMP superfamily)